MWNLFDIILSLLPRSVLDSSLLIGVSTVVFFFIEYRNKNTWSKKQATLNTLSQYATADFIEARYEILAIADRDILSRETSYTNVIEKLKSNQEEKQIIELNRVLEQILFKFEFISGGIKQKIATEKIVKHYSGNLLPTIFENLLPYIEEQRRIRKYKGYCEDMEYFAKKWNPKSFK